MGEVSILACAPVNPEQYDEARRSVWNSAIKSGLQLPPRYPGSIHKPCDTCGITVQVGPRQQEFLESQPDAAVLCLVDAVHLPGVQRGLHVTNLGNPFKEKK